MSTADEVYARIDDLVPPSDLEILDGFGTAIAERNNLAARLAEVEGKLETAEGEAYYWRSLCSEDDRVEQLQRRLAEVEAENARLRELALVEAEGQHDEMLGATGLAAERDRLAQELEDAKWQADGLRAVLAVVTDVTIETIARLGGLRYGGDWAERCARGENELRALYEDMRLESFWAKEMYGESGAAATAREFVARFPREGDGDDS